MTNRRIGPAHGEQEMVQPERPPRRMSLWVAWTPFVLGVGLAAAAVLFGVLPAAGQSLFVPLPWDLAARGACSR